MLLLRSEWKLPPASICFSSALIGSEWCPQCETVALSELKYLDSHDHSLSSCRQQHSNLLCLDNRHVVIDFWSEQVVNVKSHDNLYVRWCTHSPVCSVCSPVCVLRWDDSVWWTANTQSALTDYVALTCTNIWQLIFFPLTWIWLKTVWYLSVCLQVRREAADGDQRTRGLGGSQSFFIAELSQKHSGGSARHMQPDLFWSISDSFLIYVCGCRTWSQQLLLVCMEMFFFRYGPLARLDSDVERLNVISKWT